MKAKPIKEYLGLWMREFITIYGLQSFLQKFTCCSHKNHKKT